jgi:phosphate starvation-inducible PhoH-like protein
MQVDLHHQEVKLPKARRRENVQDRDPRFAHDQQRSNLIEIKPYLKKKQQVSIIPRNIAQEKYVELLKNPKKYIVFAIGPAGTGKTMLGVQMAIKQLKEGVISKIIITRPAVSVDEEHGFLPGTLNQKMEPWTRPLLDVLREYYSAVEIARMLEEQIIEIAPLAFMRGRTFKNSWIIADEMQNATPNQLKMLMTRIGIGSKIVITGDIEQTDRKTADNGLLDLQNRLGKGVNSGIQLCTFGPKDVQRHHIIEQVLNLYR